MSRHAGDPGARSEPAQKGHRLPDVIGLGAVKCGTTSLHYYLRAHPEIGVQKIKEMQFFSDSGTWSKGVEWYVRQFPLGKRTLMESHGGTYTAFPTEPAVPERIHALIPQARFVYVVRDPIDRMISRYVHLYSNSVESRPIDEALLDAKDPEYIPQSLYFMQMERYLKYFDASRFLIVAHQDLLHDRAKTLRAIFRFLNVRDDFWSREFEIIRHSSAQKRRNTRLGMIVQRAVGEPIFHRLRDARRHWFKKLVYTPFSTVISRPQLAPETRQKLREVFKDDVRHLAGFAGRHFPGWLS